MAELLGQWVLAPGWALPEASAPARFVRLLAEVVPDWRVDPPDPNDVDLHVSAMDPSGSGRSVSVTASWPTNGGYRGIDEWRVTGYGHHLVTVEMHLCHDAGRAEWDMALRLLRATWALPYEMSGRERPGPAGDEEGLMEVKGTDAFVGAQWFKSSKSGAAGHCVEAAFLENNRVGVRDSKNPAGPALLFGNEAWDSFVTGVRAGEFDRA